MGTLLILVFTLIVFTLRKFGPPFRKTPGITFPRVINMIN
ncbi:hypothetical protein LINPERHAP1_LOCUS7210 [Linum perenne]